MPATVDLKEMTTEEKWRLWEELWTDLTKNEADIDPPVWHGDILEERDRLIESGEEEFIDWEVAKKELLEQLK